MNRTLLARFAIICAAFVFIGAGRGGGGGSAGRGGGGFRGGGARGGSGRSGSMGRASTPRPRVVIKMRHVSVPQPDRTRTSQNVVRDNRQISYPRRNESGGKISQSAARNPPQQHSQITRNHSLVQNIGQRERRETTVNHFYWHNEGGVRYAHYYDSHGTHWYGFYHGPSFYWTRYWGNRWWWYDPHFSRWVYWWSGYWWWPAPTGVPYAYVDNGYYPYESGGVVTTANPELQTPPATAPASPSEGSMSASPDTSRTVQIDDQGNAYLYDMTTGQAVFMKYLGQDVSKVKFSGGENGKPVQIMLEFKDGSFALYDTEGNPLDAPSVSSDDTPGPPPAAMPPTPDATSTQ